MKKNGTNQRKSLKILFKSFVFFSILILVTFLTRNAYANSGTAKCYYNSSLSPGYISTISSYLTSKGYTSSYSANPSVATMQSALTGSNKVVFFHTHGSNQTPMLVCSNGNLYASSISSSSDKFVYLSTCYSAYPANSNSSFRGKMWLAGVPQTLGFRSTISASTDSNGIHFFNVQVFNNLVAGYTLSSAVSTAQSIMYVVNGSYSGSDQVEFTGGPNVLP